MSSSYQSVREQLVSLQVDLDDREKLCEVVQQKIEVERAKLGRIESDANVQYEGVLESELEDGQREIVRLRNSSTFLMNKKKEMVDKCQALVDKVKESEKDLSADCRKVHREASEALDLEKRQYRQGHQQRLARFIAGKAAEEKSSTANALKPEFARLRQMHEHEMADVEAKAKADERRLKSGFQERLEELVNEEREAHLENQKSVSRSRVDAVQTEFEASDREHRARLRALQAELDRDLDKAHLILKNNVEKERQGGQNEVLHAQETFQTRIQDLRARHMGEMAALIKDHDLKCRQIQIQADKAHSSVEQRVKLEWGGGEGGGDDDASGQDQESFLRDIQQDRDRRLQIEIRHLQAETVRLERSWKAKAEEERHHIVSSREKEETESQRRQRQLTEQVADVVVEREQLSKDVQYLSKQKTNTQSDLLELRKEIGVYQGGISAHRSRIRDINSLHTAKMRDEENAHESRVMDFKNRTDRARTQIRAKEQHLNRDLGALEQMHVSEMEKLDRQVKSDVARKDEDLDLLRDAVQTEKVKVSKIEKLIKSQSIPIK